LLFCNELDQESLHNGSYAACIQDSDRPIKLKPDHAITWPMRGEAKVAISDKADAKRDLDHAVALTRGDEFYITLRDKTRARS
jgi:hypothetical protein